MIIEFLVWFTGLKRSSAMEDVTVVITICIAMAIISLIYITFDQLLKKH